MSDINFCNTKEQLNHLGEVVTGKVDGSPTGADIETSILPYTGQVRKTLPALEAEYLEAIQGTGGVSIGVWTSGVTTFNAYNEYAVFNGIPYKPRTTTTFPYVAQGADPTASPDDVNVQPYQEITEAQVISLVESTVPDEIPKYSRIEFDSVASAVSSISNGEYPLGTNITISDYYGSQNPNMSGVLYFTVVAGGSGSDDGGKYIDVPLVNLQLKQTLGTKPSLQAFGLKDGINGDSIIESALSYYDTEGGAVITSKPGSYPIVDKIQLRTGMGIAGDGVSPTFDDERVGVTLIHSPISVADIAIQFGQDGSPVSNRATKAESIKIIGDKVKSIGFSSVNTEDPGNTKNSINWSGNKIISEKCLIGFDIRNTWNYELNLNTAVDCDTGFRISGTVQGGGTSNNWEAVLAYVCRIGFDIQADGWSYSAMKACGADTCDVALKLSGASARGSSIENFGIEGIGNYPGSTTKVGVLVDYSGAGYYDLNGLHFAIHDDPSITFISIVNNRNIIFTNIDVPSSVLNSCKFYSQTNPSNSGRVEFRGGSLYGADLGDIYETNVQLTDIDVNGRIYRNAMGGFDSEPQEVIYSSVMSAASNNQIYSKLIKASPDTTFDRIFTGTPSFNATKLKDYDRFTIVNTSTTNKLVFRTEDSLAGSGIVRNSTINPSNDISLLNDGDSVTFEKRADGKLYQIGLYSD